MFDRSRKTLFGAAEGGPGGDSLPRFQPQPGGFGKRQTPVSEAGAPGGAPPEAASRGNARRDSEPRAQKGSGAADNSSAHPGAHPGAPAAPHSNDNPPADPLGMPAVAEGLGVFGSGQAPGSDHVPAMLEAWLNREFRHLREAQCETMLSVVGALAGFAAQHGIWEAEVRPGKMAIQEAFVIIETRSGETFFFGDFLNTILAAPDPAQLSVWKIVAGAARALGAEELPEMTAIFKHCAETVGTGAFGLPRLPDGHVPTILPRDALNRYWPEARRILAGNRDPLTWALDVAVAAQQMMLGMKGRIDPALAAQVVMEAAVPMSRVDPMTVPKD